MPSSPERRGVVAVQVSKTGPTFGLLEVGKDNLRRIIGPQGSVIKGLEAESNSRLSIDDAGLVHIYSPTQPDYQTAVASIGGITGASIKVRRQRGLQIRARMLSSTFLMNALPGACILSV